MNNVRQLAKAQQFCIERDRSAAFSGFLQPRSELRSGKQAARSASDETFVAWPTRILPHLEQIELHEAIVENRDGGGFADGVPPFIEVFQCPSDPQVDPSAPALSYVVNSGMPDLVEASEDHPSDLRANGVCHDQRPGRFGPTVRMADVKDGLSTTMLLSENVHRDPAGSASQPGNTWLRPATGATNLEQWYGMVWLVDERNPRLPGPELWAPFNRDPRSDQELDQLYAASGTRFARPASEHADIFNVAFCGGNVKEIHEDIDYAVYQQLMTPDGAKAAPADAPDQRFEKTLPDDLRFMNPPITDADY